MISAFGVTSRMVSRMIHGRVALIGDAAHEISPIGGQGMNLGWLDAVALAPIISEALRTSAGALPPRNSLDSSGTGSVQRRKPSGRPASTWRWAALAPEGPQRKERGDRPSHHLADVLGACCP